ncbi:hypothetical protein ACFT2C_18755 [Promicromonospora sp. NPDC057138]|uniref:hypothetical protein n=1 Tax=Promicromonospora sp. NPDC057138 TaxID=3346031 RepID=UPI00363FA649
MTSVDAVDPAEATETESPRRRRGSWIPVTVIVALFVGIAAWQGVARIGRVETGSSTSSFGTSLPDCLPSGDDWTLFGGDDDVVVAHTVRNPSPWPVTVISTDPDVYRFEPVGDDRRLDDTRFANRSADGGAPDGTQSAVIIPPGRSVAMWIVNPQGDVQLGNDTWQGYEGAPLRIRSLGVERDVNMPYRGTLWVSGREDIDRMGKAMQEACDA